LEKTLKSKFNNSNSITVCLIHSPSSFFLENTPNNDFSLWSVIRARILPQALWKKKEEEAFFWYCIFALPQVSTSWCNKQNHLKKLLSEVVTASDEALIFWYFIKDFGVLLKNDRDGNDMEESATFRSLVYRPTDVGTDAAYHINSDFLAFVEGVDDCCKVFDGKRFDNGDGLRLWISVMKLAKAVRAHPCNRLAELVFKNRCFDEVNKRKGENDYHDGRISKKARGSVGFEYDFEEIADNITHV
jgi:hypothetical protein